MTTWPIQMLIYAPGEAAPLVGHPDSLLGVQLRDLEAVATNPTVSAVAQLEDAAGLSVRRVLGSGAGTPEAAVRTVKGDPNELGDFTRWSAGTAPAERHVLILSGQGVAFRDERIEGRLRQAGLAPPPPQLPIGRRHPRHLFGRRSSAQTEAQPRALLIDEAFLRGFESRVPNADLGIAVERAADGLGRRLACVVFDSCEIASLELLAEVSDAASTAVCPLNPFSVGVLNLRVAALAMAETETPSPRHLAASLVETYMPIAPNDGFVAVDLDAPSFHKGLDKFASFARTIAKWLSDDHAARERLTAASAVADSAELSLIDLADLARLLNSIEGVPVPSKTALKAVIDELSGAVIAKNPPLGERLGIAVYWPASGDQYRCDRPDVVRNRLAALTRWDRVLDTLYL